MKVIRIIFAEFKMNLLAAFSYKFGIISDIIVFGILQVLLFFGDTGSSLSNTYVSGNSKELLLIGYIAWVLSCACITTIGGEIKHELMSGTFYHKMKAKVPISVLYIGKLLAALLMQIITIVSLLAISFFLFKIKIDFNPFIVLNLMVCMIGMYGLGLIVAGFAVIYKQINSLVFIIELILLFVSDVLTKNDSLQFLVNIIPLSYCNDLSRKSISNTPILPFDLLKYIILCSVLLVIGIFVFNSMLKSARKKGNLLQF